jgi:hypothetical protein
MNCWTLLAAVAATVVVRLFPAIPQSEADHNFVDQRPLLGIANCLNVISNAPFPLIGLAGRGFTLRNARTKSVLVDARGRRPVSHCSEAWRLPPSAARGITIAHDPSARGVLELNLSKWDEDPLRCRRSDSSAWGAPKTSSIAR